MKYYFIINPTAGKGNLQDDIIKSINTYFDGKDIDFEILITEFKGDALNKAKMISEKDEESTVFACGGEGTCFEILNGIIGNEKINLGVIPCGSANDFLKIFNDKNTFFDISSQIKGENVKMDVIKAGDKYCLNNCSVGMDAIVARDMYIFKTLPFVSGPMAYKLAIVKTFFGKVGIKIKMKVDNGIPKLKNCLFAVIANAPFYGGGYNAAPKAVPNDGKLNLTVVDTISKLKVPSFLKKYEHGKHEGFDFCHLSVCDKMSFTSDVPIPVNLDGEIFETKSMSFEIVKNAVNFVIPKGIHSKLLKNN